MTLFFPDITSIKTYFIFHCNWLGCPFCIVCVSHHAGLPVIPSETVDDWVSADAGEQNSLQITDVLSDTAHLTAKPFRLIVGYQNLI
jgi:hypothetical protein